jgi:hypothetical protein
MGLGTGPGLEILGNGISISEGAIRDFGLKSRNCTKLHNYLGPAGRG